MPIEEEQMRWVKSLFSLQGRQRYLCLWVCKLPCPSSLLQLIIIRRSERKLSQNRTYPKGYTEMLEQQQSQLVSGLKEMYHRLRKISAWDGPPLDESSGQALTHDILSALNLLKSRYDDSDELEVLEENCNKLQSRKFSKGANLVRRRGSMSSDSDHSHYDQPKTASSRSETPVQLKFSFFDESSNFASASSSPLTQSPAPRPKPFAQQQYPAPSPARQLPRQESTLVHDPQLYEPGWAQTLANMSCLKQAYGTTTVMHTSDFDGFTPFDAAHVQIEAYQSPSYLSQMSNANRIGGLPDISDLAQLDTMNSEFCIYMQQPEVMT
jgi:hypothetical protein